VQEQLPSRHHLLLVSCVLPSLPNEIMTKIRQPKKNKVQNDTCEIQKAIKFRQDVQKIAYIQNSK